MDAMDIVPNALPRRPRVRDRGALLPLVMLVTTVYWGIRPWTLLVIVIAAAVALGLVPITAAGVPVLAAGGVALLAGVLTGPRGER